MSSRKPTSPYISGSSATPLEGDEEKLDQWKTLTWIENLGDVAEVTKFQYGIPPGGVKDIVAGTQIYNRFGRNFETGAYRDTDEGKYDYEGFLSPLVLERYAEYMNKHRTQSNGELRDSDNWQKGIPKLVYIKSGWRHFMDWWMEHRKITTNEGLEEALCALLFNVMGYLHEVLKEKD